MSDQEQVLADIRAEIARMSEYDQVQITAIAMTLRNVLKAGGSQAQIALALVGAEQAAA